MGMQTRTAELAHHCAELDPRLVTYIVFLTPIELEDLPVAQDHVTGLDLAEQDVAHGRPYNQIDFAMTIPPSTRLCQPRLWKISKPSGKLCPGSSRSRCKPASVRFREKLGRS